MYVSELFICSLPLTYVHANIFCSFHFNWKYLWYLQNKTFFLLYCSQDEPGESSKQSTYTKMSENNRNFFGKFLYFYDWSAQGKNLLPHLTPLHNFSSSRALETKRLWLHILCYIHTLTFYIHKEMAKRENKEKKTTLKFSHENLMKRKQWNWGWVRERECLVCLPKSRNFYTCFCNRRENKMKNWGIDKLLSHEHEKIFTRSLLWRWNYRKVLFK